MNSKLNHEWTARDFAKAKPASNVLGQIFSRAVGGRGNGEALSRHLKLTRDNADKTR